MEMGFTKRKSQLRKKVEKNKMLGHSSVLTLNTEHVNHCLWLWRESFTQAAKSPTSEVCLLHEPKSPTTTSSASLVGSHLLILKLFSMDLMTVKVVP